jgi:hypothetical protein
MRLEFSRFFNTFETKKNRPLMVRAERLDLARISLSRRTILCTVLYHGLQGLFCISLDSMGFHALTCLLLFVGPKPPRRFAHGIPGSDSEVHEKAKECLFREDLEKNATTSKRFRADHDRTTQAVTTDCQDQQTRST